MNRSAPSKSPTNWMLWLRKQWRALQGNPLLPNSCSQQLIPLLMLTKETPSLLMNSDECFPQPQIKLWTWDFSSNLFCVPRHCCNKSWNPTHRLLGTLPPHPIDALTSSSKHSQHAKHKWLLQHYSKRYVLLTAVLNTEKFAVENPFWLALLSVTSLLKEEQNKIYYHLNEKVNLPQLLSLNWNSCSRRKGECSHFLLSHPYTLRHWSLRRVIDQK